MGRFFLVFVIAVALIFGLKDLIPHGGTRDALFWFAGCALGFAAGCCVGWYTKDVERIKEEIRVLREMREARTRHNS